PWTDDVALEASFPYAARRFALRLHPALYDQKIRNDNGEAANGAGWGRIAAFIEGADRPSDLVHQLLESDAVPESWRNVLTHLKSSNVSFELPYTPNDGDLRKGIVLNAKRGVRMREQPFDEVAEFSESATESGDLSSSSSNAFGESLSAHSRKVRDLARAFANRLGFAADAVDDVALAAFLHDLGKADTRFQRYLQGDPWRIGEVLAKSPGRRSPTEDAAARRSAGLPRTWRHEVLSVRIALNHEHFSQANDPELVLWLIGTHHGYGRPLFPPTEAGDETAGSYAGFDPYTTAPLHVRPSPGPQRLDFALEIVTPEGPMSIDWTMLFDRLTERYGVWGLAHLEGIVRLADHRASESVVAGAESVRA
ncbi:MAG: CRISPR-associated endonuclease Cas3'', partial [Vulcanimicrobiaceae bacterium]